MALLDQVLAGLSGGSGGGTSGLGGVLAGLLGGGQGGGQTAGMGGGLAGLLGGGQAGGQTAGMGGGLAGLLSSFEQAGLGHIAQSWVGNGANQPVSPDQLQQVFGQDRIQGMASQAGMAPHDFLAQLSEHLPTAVDHMTPGGQVPESGSMSV